MMLQNTLVGGNLDLSLTFDNNGIVTLRPLPSAQYQYYHEFQLKDGICQLRALNNFLGGNIYNPHTIIPYLSHIYDNFESINFIVTRIKILLETIFGDYFHGENKYYRLFLNIKIFIDFFDSLRESYYGNRSSQNIGREEIIKDMFSPGIYDISTGDETIDLTTSEIIFLLLFRLDKDTLYFTPVGSIFGIDQLVPSKTIFDIYTILEINFINKFHVGDSIRNHSYVYHLHEENNTITKVDSLISSFELDDRTIDRIQPTLTHETIIKPIYTFYINEGSNRNNISKIKPDIVDYIYENYFRNLKKFVTEQTMHGTDEMEDDVEMFHDSDSEYDFDYDSDKS